MTYKAYSDYSEDELERAEQQLIDQLIDDGYDPEEEPPSDEAIEEQAALNREPDPDEYHDRRVDRQMDDDYFRANDYLND